MLQITRVYIAALLFFSITSFGIYAQESKMLHPNTPIKSLVFKKWTAEDGLMSNNLTSVKVDREGFIWITAFNGVLRFDGNQMELFDSRNYNFLNSNAFMNTFFTKNNTGFFSTQASGIVKYKNSELVKPEFNNDSELPNYIRSIYVDSSGVIWAGANSIGLYKIQDNEISAIGNNAVRNISVMDIQGDAADRIYVATHGNGMVVIENNKVSEFTTADGLADNNLNKIHVAKNGHVYIGTGKGLNELEEGRIIDKTWFSGIEINDIIEDGYGSIWVATEMGLGRINNFFNLVEFFGTEDGLPSRQVSGLCFDFEGNLWAATKKSGLIRFKNGSFETFTETDGLALNLVNCIIEKYPGAHYVGTDIGGLDKIQGKKISRVALKTDLMGNGVRDVCFVGEDEIWIGSYFGIVIKNGKDERIINTRNGLPSNDVRRLLKDSRGYIWAGTRSGGLVQFKDQKIVNIYNKENGLKSNYILSVEEDLNGEIWVGTNGGGLSSIDSLGIVNNYTIGGDNSGILIFNINIDETYKWLGTNVGLFLFDGKGDIKIELKSNSQNDSFFDVVIDDLNGIWLSSNFGLYRIEKYDIDRFLKGDLDVVPSRVFDHNDGLKNKECTGATRMLKASDGKIWVPTLGGVAIVNPALIIKNTYIPPVYITDFLTDRSGKFVSERLRESDLAVEPGNFRYQIKFTALSYQSPEKVNFKYKLSNIDEDWVETVNIREAQYTNLPPGKYTFHVLASNNDLNWNNEGASFSFVIKPFLYQRIELYIVVFLIIASGTYFGYKRRVRVIEKRNAELKRVNEELDKFVYSASHDLKAPLNSVLGLINIAKKDGPTGNMPLYLNMIEESITKLERFIADIIDYSRNASVEVVSSVIDFNAVVNETLRDLKYLDEKEGIKINTSISGKGDFMSDNRRLSVIFNNLIANAIKYHDSNKDNRYININIQFSDLHAKISVEDNGAGIPEIHQKKVFDMFYRAADDSRGSGLGLYIVKETLEKIKGTIKLESKEGLGSSFIIDLPSI